MNPWYGYTYETILNNRWIQWASPEKDIEKKTIAIYSWMPNCIMNGNNRCKNEPVMISQCFRTIFKNWQTKTNLVLWEMSEQEIDSLGEIIETVFKIYGPWAGSKYLHFTAYKIFMMWDTDICESYKCTKSSFGYLSFLKQTKLLVKKEKLVKKKNPLREMDIINMNNRQR